MWQVINYKADAKKPACSGHLTGFGLARRDAEMEADKLKWKGVTMRFPKADYQQYADAAQKLDVPKTKFIKMAIKLLVLFTCLVAKGWEVKLVSPKGEEKTLFFAELALEQMVEDKQAA